MCEANIERKQASLTKEATSNDKDTTKMQSLPMIVWPIKRRKSKIAMLWQVMTVIVLFAPDDHYANLPGNVANNERAKKDVHDMERHDMKIIQ